jgi:hypothetical protein
MVYFSCQQVLTYESIGAVFFLAAIVTSLLAENGALSCAPIGLLQCIAIISDFGWITLLAFQVLVRESGLHRGTEINGSRS